MRAFLFAAMVLRRWIGAMVRECTVGRVLNWFDIASRVLHVLSIQLLCIYVEAWNVSVISCQQYS